MITLDEFVKRECALWTEEYIFDLIERGYTPILTDHGYKWLYQKPQVTQETRVALTDAVCYTGSVGS